MLHRVGTTRQAPRARPRREDPASPMAALVAAGSCRSTRSSSLLTAFSDLPAVTGGGQNFDTVAKVADAIRLAGRHIGPVEQVLAVQREQPVLAGVVADCRIDQRARADMDRVRLIIACTDVAHAAAEAETPERTR